MSRELVDSGISYLKFIPKNWNIYRIKNAFKCNKETVNNEWKNQQLLSLTTKGIKEKDIDNPNGKLPESFETYQKVKRDNLVMCLFDLDISAVFSGISNFNGMISPAYKVLTCRNNMNPRYAGYYFNYISFDRKYLHYSKNIRYTLSFEEFSSLPMLFPSTIEQEKIANYLDSKISKINQTIEDNKKEIELLEEYKKNFIAEIILKNGVDITNTIDFNKQWITSVSRDTKIIPLKFLSRLQTGTTPKKFEKNVTEKKIEWFTPGDFKRLELNNSSRKLDCDLIEGTKMFPKGATLIIGIGGTLGKIGFIVEQAYSNQQITAVIPNDNKILPKYLTYNLISAMNYIKDTTPYTTLPILSNSYLNNILMCNRNLKEQNNILNKIELNKSKINNIIKYRQQIIDKLEEYKKSLIYEVVTGKIEV